MNGSRARGAKAEIRHAMAHDGVFRQRQEEQRWLQETKESIF